MKKIIALTLTILMCVLLIACNTTDTDNGESSELNQATPAASKEESKVQEYSENETSAEASDSISGSTASETADYSADTSSESSIPTESSEASDNVPDESDQPNQELDNTHPDIIGGGNYVIDYLTFEEACEESDIVVTATFLKSEWFNDKYIRHDFSVKENILGKTEKIISVYENSGEPYVDEEGQYHENSPLYKRTKLSFKKDAEYLLPLRQNLMGFLAYKTVDAYYLTFDLFVRLDNVSLSQMYSQPLSKHATGINISEKTTGAEILTYVKNITKDFVPEYTYIYSDNMADIIRESNHVVKLKVESLRGETKNTFEHTERYTCTVIEELKGQLIEKDEYQVYFIAGNVKPGDICIVAVHQSASPEDLMYTSKNSLFSLDQEEQILELINK